ncbi:MAG: pentapeptide repeat-containing protein [Deltaproteobacteria bacterium]|nr:MAG: pentapeptide repeat-containing protein [Deltaproteobacteria bacterium]
MRNRQSLSSGIYQSVTLSSVGAGNRRTGTGGNNSSYMPNAPVRRSLRGEFKLPVEDTGLPVLAETRRYVVAWTLGGMVAATLLGFLWVYLMGSKASVLASFPYVGWFVVVAASTWYAVWNISYQRHWIQFQQREREMVLHEKRVREAPKERMFTQVISAASNANPDYTAARVNAIMRIPDFILSRGGDGAYYRSIGSGLIGTILMEVNAMEREGGLERHTRMVKHAATQALIAIKEHMNGAALQDVNLSGFDLSFANLFGADLSSSRLVEANLEEANLQGASLEFCDLQKANLQSSQLQSAKLQDAVMFESNLNNARMRGIHAQRCNFQQASLQNVDLSEADLRGANLREVNLQGANLRYADLRGATLRGSSLLNADLEGADLEGADLAGADLQGARTQGANLPS